MTVSTDISLSCTPPRRVSSDCGGLLKWEQKKITLEFICKALKLAVAEECRAGQWGDLGVELTWFLLIQL